MKNALLLCLAFLLLAKPAPGQKPVTLDDCFAYFQFFAQSAAEFRFAPSSNHYFQRDEAGNIVEHDLGTGQVSRTLVQADDLLAVGQWDDYVFSNDLSAVLLRTNTQPVYRHSVTADYWVFDRKARRAERLYTAGPVQYAAFSEAGDKVAFVAGNNLFYKNLRTGATSQVTTDGKKNTIINGLPDWVYEEEFSPVAGAGMVATAWSADGTKLAFIRFDESAVPEFPITWYTNQA
ncbi:MAG: DPP IV N-terminal domain-containing protein, partial [Saprospiraceae bacterium]